MRTLLTILLLPFFAFAQGKRIPVYPTSDGLVYQLNVMKAYNPQTDDTLVLMNKSKLIKAVKLETICGVKDHEVVITWEDPSTPIGGYASYSFVLNKAANVKVQNFLIDGQNKANSLFSLGYGTQNITIENFVLRNGYSVGMFIKCDPDSSDLLHTTYPSIIKNITVRYGKVMNVQGEGFYIGNSHPQYTNGLISVPVVNLTVDNITTENTGWDGFQLSNVWNFSGSNIYIKNSGLLNVKSQQHAFLAGTAVTFASPLMNLTIEGGTGSALMILARGLLQFKNVTIKNAATTAGESAIFLDDRSSPFKDQGAQQVELEDVVIEGAAKAAIYNYNRTRTSLPMKVHNLTYSGTSLGVVDYSKGIVWNDTIIKPVDTVQTPVDTVKYTPVDTLVIVQPKNDTLYLTVSGNYTAQPTPLHQVITFSGDGKLYLPDVKLDSMYIKILNPDKHVVKLGNRWYFSNGKYRLIVGWMMAGLWREVKNRFYIQDRTDFKK